MGSGRNVHVIHFDWGGGGGGQIPNTFFESGGKSVADPEGVQGVRSNPPLELNYFIFMGNFRKNEAKLRKRTPYLNLNPLSRNPGSALANVLPC